MPSYPFPNTTKRQVVGLVTSMPRIFPLWSQENQNVKGLFSYLANSRQAWATEAYAFSPSDWGAETSELRISLVYIVSSGQPGQI